MRGIFSGTLSYASVNALKGKVLSRRDDLISLGYALIKLIKKNLPWTSNLNPLNRATFTQLINLKQNDAYGKLFESIPVELVDFIKYSKNLKFEQYPDYSYLRSLFIKVLAKKELDYKTLPFTFLNKNKKKMKNIPRYNSKRRESPYSRILQNLQEKINKKAKSELKSSKNLNINQNFTNIPISINYNIQISSDKDKNIIYNNYLAKNNTWNKIPSKELKSELKNKGKIRTKEIKEYNSKKNNFTINVNESNIENKKIPDKSILLTNYISKKYTPNGISSQEMLKRRIREINKNNKTNTSSRNNIKAYTSYYNINRKECLKGRQNKIIYIRNK